MRKRVRGQRTAIKARQTRCCCTHSHIKETESEAQTLKAHLVGGNGPRGGRRPLAVHGLERLSLIDVVLLAAGLGLHLVAVELDLVLWVTKGNAMRVRHAVAAG